MNAPGIESQLMDGLFENLRLLEALREKLLPVLTESDSPPTTEVTGAPTREKALVVIAETHEVIVDLDLRLVV